MAVACDRQNNRGSSKGRGQVTITVEVRDAIFDLDTQKPPTSISHCQGPYFQQPTVEDLIS